LLVVGVVVFAVRGAAAAAVDFEDLSPATPYTGPGGGYYWNGPAANAHDEPDPWGGPLPVKVGTFQSGNVEFVNRYNMNYSSWSGFAYSNTSDTTTAGHTNQFSAYTGSGYGGSGNYGVAFGYLDVLDPSDPTQLQQLPYFELPDYCASIENAYVTNTTYAALSMLHGDSFAKKFGGDSGDDPDWFKLSIYGTDASGIPLLDTVEFYLADYRFTDNSQDYIVDQWTLLDLSPLADAQRLYFNPSSSDVGDWGMNTPGYFAIDNISFTAVPEPSTLAMFTGGGLIVGALSFLRRRKSSH
jgi:hypothetical protein